MSYPTPKPSPSLNKRISADDSIHNSNSNSNSNANSNSSLLKKHKKSVQFNNDKSSSVEETLAVKAQEALFFHIVASSEELPLHSATLCASRQECHINYCNQFLDSEELIYGYRDLHVDIYFSATSLRPYISISYSYKVPVGATNITERLCGKILKFSTGDNDEDCRYVSLLCSTATDRLEIFKQNFEMERKFIPAGICVYEEESLERKVHDKGTSPSTTLSTTLNGSTLTTSPVVVNDVTSSMSRRYQVFKTNACDALMAPYIASLQTFALVSIDGASSIDPSDKNWEIFCVYQVISNPSPSSLPYILTAFATVYTFVCIEAGRACPLERKRISQVVVLPPYRRLGLGELLLCSIYHSYKEFKTVFEITVEEPNEAFSLLRDSYDIKRLMLNNFCIDELYTAPLYGFEDLKRSQERSDGDEIPIKNNDLVSLSPSFETMQKIRSVLYMTSTQIKKCYEFLKYFVLMKRVERNEHNSNEALTRFRREAKAKIYLNNEEMFSLLNNNKSTDTTQKIEALNLLYIELVEEYEGLKKRSGFDDLFQQYLSNRQPTDSCLKGEVEVVAI